MHKYLQPENFLLIPRFEGQKPDTVLLDLIPFLRNLSDSCDMRDVSKKYEEHKAKYAEKGTKKFDLAASSKELSAGVPRQRT